MQSKKQSMPFAWILVWALALGWAAPGRAQTSAPAPPTGPPDVLAIIYQRPGMGDQVGITYASTVPHAQAQRDLDALAQASGWTPAEVKITDAPAPVQGKMGAMTGVSFIAPSVIHDETHAFPLEAFIRAFRSYKRLALVFFVSSSFQFQGLRQFADNNVQIAMEQHGSAYTYRIQIFNPQFDHLNLPPSGSAGMTPGPVQRRSPLLLLLGLIGAAVVTGIVVYFVMARMTPPPDEAHLPSDEAADEKTEIGTKG